MAKVTFDLGKAVEGFTSAYYGAKNKQDEKRAQQFYMDMAKRQHDLSEKEFKASQDYRDWEKGRANKEDDEKALDRAKKEATARQMISMWNKNHPDQPLDPGSGIDLVNAVQQQANQDRSFALQKEANQRSAENTAEMRKSREAGAQREQFATLVAAGATPEDAARISGFATGGITFSDKNAQKQIQLLTQKAKNSEAAYREAISRGGVSQDERTRLHDRALNDKNALDDASIKYLGGKDGDFVPAKSLHLTPTDREVGSAQEEVNKLRQNNTFKDDMGNLQFDPTFATGAKIMNIPVGAFQKQYMTAQKRYQTMQGGRYPDDEGMIPNTANPPANSGLTFDKNKTVAQTTADAAAVTAKQNAAQQAAVPATPGTMDHFKQWYDYTNNLFNANGQRQGGLISGAPNGMTSLPPIYSPYIRDTYEKQIGKKLDEDTWNEFMKHYGPPLEPQFQM